MFVSRLKSVSRPKSVSRLLPGLAVLGLVATGAHAQSAAPAAMTDGQIVDYVQAVNVGEVKDAKLALRRTKSADVKGFADHMVTDHTAAHGKMAALARKLKLKLANSDATKSLMAEAKAGDATLTADKEPAFDKDYIAAQAKMHGEVGDTIQNQLIPAARNDDVKSALTETLSTVRDHEKMAQDLAAKMQ